MSPPPDFTVAICGAGLGGLGLALALHSHGIPCIVYEARSNSTHAIKGSLQLAPNGQAALASYDILPQLAAQSCFYRSAIVRDKHGNATREISLGGKEAFGYDSMRIIRARLVDELVKAVEHRGIAIVYNKKFVRVVSETSDAVTVEFADGKTATASLLVGADGIWSRVRRALYPDISPSYIGHAAVGTSVARSQITGLQPSHTGMYVGDHGALLLGQHVPDESEYLLALQKPWPDLGRAGCEALTTNNQALLEFLRDGYGQWPPHIQSALDNAKYESLYFWPMYTLPELDSWRSASGRVVLIGDAAHAMPPTAGQGANMAFEDGHTLGLVLAACQRGTKVGEMGRTVDEGIEFWQRLRQRRIEAVLEYTMLQNRLRQAKETKAEIAIGDAAVGARNGNGADAVESMRWLFGGVPLQEEKIKSWIEQGCTKV